MEIRDIIKVEQQRGIASTVKSEDLIPAYTEGVQKFLRNHQLEMGDDWVKMVGERLYKFSGKNKEGDVLGSSTDMGVAIATFCPEIPLITGQQLLELYSRAENKNPFGSVYIDFGVHINGEHEVNPTQAKILLNDFKAKGIELGEGRVPNFNQLKLIADKDAGLAYKLTDDVCFDSIAVVSAYPFEGRVGKNGLFGACLGRDGGWYAGGGGLRGSDDCGRVVRYDAEGVAPKKLEKPAKDLVTTLTGNFMRKF